MRISGIPAGGARLGQLGLADAGRTLHQDRLLQVLRQEHGGGDLAAADIAGASQPGDHRVDRGAGRMIEVVHEGVWSKRARPSRVCWVRRGCFGDIEGFLEVAQQRRFRRAPGEVEARSQRLQPLEQKLRQHARAHQPGLLFRRILGCVIERLRQGEGQRVERGDKSGERASSAAAARAELGGASAAAWSRR